MDSTQTLKLQQFNTNQKQTALAISRYIGNIDNEMGAALAHQAYARKNPDLVVDQGLLDRLSANVDELMAPFSSVAEKRDDILAVRSGTMTVDELITKYNIDLTSYSNSLA